MSDGKAFAPRYGRCGICGEHYTDRVDHLVYQHGWAKPGLFAYIKETFPKLLDQPEKH